jgi:hypothetical protein
VDTGVGEYGRFTGFVAEYDEVVGKNENLLRRGAKVLGANDRVPKIDVHLK